MAFAASRRSGNLKRRPESVPAIPQRRNDNDL